MMTKLELEAAVKKSANLQNVDLRGADLQNAYLQYADLQYADLQYADLQNADLHGANLQYADLQNADLQNANLQYVNLQNAENLWDANLGNQWIVQGGIRKDGYQFILTNFKGEGVRVKAGCRNFTWNKAITHWTKRRSSDDPLSIETWLLLGNLWDLAVARGLSWENL